MCLINYLKNPTIQWNAKLYDHLIGKSISSINKYAGRKKYFQELIQFNKKSQELNYNYYQLEDLSDLPKNFTWEQYLSPARE
jgi:predicted RNA-binding protein with EMAP domain